MSVMEGESTFGKTLCGRSSKMTPDAKGRMDRLTELMSEAADIIDSYDPPLPMTEMEMYIYNTLKGGAIRRILDAKMWGVQVVTFNPKDR